MNLAVFKYLKIFKNYLGIKIYFIYFLSAITGLSDSLGIALIVPLFRTLDTKRVLEDNEGLFVKAFYKFFKILNIEITPINVITMVFIIFVIKSLSMFLVEAITAYYEQIISKKIRMQLCKNSFEMSYQYYLEQDSGYFSNILTEQTVIGASLMKSSHNI